MIRLDVDVIDRAIEYLFLKLRGCTDIVMDTEHGIPTNSISATILMWTRIRYNIVSGGGGQTPGRLWINSNEYQGWKYSEKYTIEGEYQYQILRALANEYTGRVPNTRGVAPNIVSHGVYERIQNWGDRVIRITAKFSPVDISAALTRLFPEYVPIPENKSCPPLDDNLLGLPDNVIAERRFKKSVHNLNQIVDDLLRE